MRQLGPPRSLREDLSSLPRQPASADFTQGVLAELQERQRSASPRRTLSPWLALSAVALVLLLGIGYAYRQSRAADRAYRRQVEELRSSYEQLLGEVASIRKEVEDPEPLLYLGGDDAVDLVLDLNPPPNLVPETARQGGQVRPANWQP